MYSPGSGGLVDDSAIDPRLTPIAFRTVDVSWEVELLVERLVDDPDFFKHNN